MKISTTYRANSSGAGRITAKGGGKQRTINYDHSFNTRDNHRMAMENLAMAHGIPFLPRTEQVEIDNGRAVFSL